MNFRCPATVRQLPSRITTHNVIHQRLREIADEGIEITRIHHASFFMRSASYRREN